MATTQGKLLVMKSNWEDLGISMMDKVRPAINYILDGLTKLFAKLGSSKKFLGVIENVANFLAISLRVVYEVMKLLFNLIIDNWSSVVMGLTAIGTVMLALSAKALVLQLANPFTYWMAGIIGTIIAVNKLSSMIPSTDVVKDEASNRKDMYDGGNKKFSKAITNTLNGYSSGGKNWSMFKEGLVDMTSSAAFYDTFNKRRESGMTRKQQWENSHKDNTGGGKTLQDEIFGDMGKWMKNIIAPKGSKQEESLTKLMEIISKTPANLGGNGKLTESGDAVGTLASSSPLSSVANEFSRSIVVNIHDGLLHVENQYIGSSNGELGTDDIERQLSDALVHIVQDYELGMSN